MTKEIRRAIEMIPVSSRKQHGRIKDALKLICDEIDFLHREMASAHGLGEKDIEELVKPGELKGATPKLAALKKSIEAKKEKK